MDRPYQLVLVISIELLVIGAILASSPSLQSESDGLHPNRDIRVDAEDPIEHLLLPNISVNITRGKQYRPIPMYQVSTNNAGFRDDPIPAYNRSVTRILVIGDSYTFGWGVNKSDRYTEILEQQLASETDQDYITINMGVPGHGMKDFFHVLEEKGVAAQPDILIVMFADWDTLHSEWFDREWSYWKEQIPENARNRQERIEERVSITAQTSVNNMVLTNSSLLQNMNRITNTAKEHNITLVFFSHHVFSDSEQAYLSRWAASRNVTYIPPPPYWQPYRYTISSFDAHYNAEGHQVLGTWLYTQLQACGVVPPVESASCITP